MSEPPVDAARTERPPRAGGPTRVLLLGLVVGVWAMLPVLVGPQVETATSVEVVDHLIPGVVVLLITTALILHRERSETLLFLGGLAVALPGVFMTATHVPLLAQAASGQTAWPTALHHSLPPLATLALGLGWAWRYR